MVGWLISGSSGVVTNAAAVPVFSVKGATASIRSCCNLKRSSVGSTTMPPRPMSFQGFLRARSSYMGDQCSEADDEHSQEITLHRNLPARQAPDLGTVKQRPLYRLRLWEFEGGAARR